MREKVQQLSAASENIDPQTVEGFGQEWAAYDQTDMPADEYERLFRCYFSIFPFDALPPTAEGFDLGCGSGRWAAGVARRVAKLNCIDPSEQALDVARKALVKLDNVEFFLAAADQIPVAPESQDFGYSLGVLHHVPNTARALADCVTKLKPGAPFLVYLYYAFDNRPVWFRSLWQLSDAVRKLIYPLPFRARRAVTSALAVTVYWPLARAAWLAERMGAEVENFPLSAYRSLSLYTMRTDSLDRFGTRLEQRFSKPQIEQLMTAAGLIDIRFSDGLPYWVACGRKGSAG